MKKCERTIHLTNSFGKAGKRKCGKIATHNQTDGLPICEYHYNKMKKKEIDFNTLNRELNKQPNTLMGLVNKCIDRDPYSRKSYDNRAVPQLIFTQAFCIKGSALYIAGDVYDTYHYSWDRMINLRNLGIIK